MASEEKKVPGFIGVYKRKTLNSNKYMINISLGSNKNFRMANFSTEYVAAAAVNYAVQILQELKEQENSLGKKSSNKLSRAKNDNINIDDFLTAEDKRRIKTKVQEAYDNISLNVPPHVFGKMMKHHKQHDQNEIELLRAAEQEFGPFDPSMHVDLDMLKAFVGDNNVRKNNNKRKRSPSETTDSYGSPSSGSSTLTSSKKNKGPKH